MQLALVLGALLTAASNSAAPASATPESTAGASQPGTIPATVVSLALPAGPYTPTHFRWPMRFSILIDARGRVTAVRELDGQRDIEAYIKAIRAARFKPARSNGIAVASSLNLSVDIPDMHGRPRSVFETPGAPPGSSSRTTERAP